MITWVNGDTAVINGGRKYKFTGIIRGQGYVPITYYADSIEEITDGLILDEWIYYIKEVKPNDTIATTVH